MMAGTMKAAVFREVGKPLVIEELPIPQPAGRELLVRVKAASLCHSDVDIMSGLYDAVLPLIVGHEALCIVEQLGPDAATYGFKIGDYVGAPPFHDMCLTCVDCRTAGPDFCKNTKMKGLSTGGYFSEYTVVDAASAVVVPIPPDSNLGFDRFAPLFCAGITAWDALERAQIGIGETVAVIGMGGVGQMVAQYAYSFGAKVLALDIRDEQLIASQNDGIVDEIFNTQKLQGAELVQKILAANGGVPVDHALVTSGAIAAYDTALSILKAEGQLVAVGLPSKPLSFRSFDLAIRCIRITGAKVAGQKCAQRCVNFSIRKDVLPKVNKRKFQLEDINEMVALMRAGKVDEGRMVVEFF